MEEYEKKDVWLASQIFKVRDGDNIRLPDENKRYVC